MDDPSAAVATGAASGAPVDEETFLPLWTLAGGVGLTLATAVAARLWLRARARRRPDTDAPLTPVEAERADFVVVGAGSSGATLAVRLAQAMPEKRVLLLEAGPQDENKFIHIPVAAFKVQVDDPELNWRYETEPQPSCNDRVHFWPRARFLGGCSGMNFMLYVRGSRHCYDRWAREYGCDGWAWDDVLPLFRRTERMLAPDLATSANHGADGAMEVSVLPDSELNPLSRAFLASCERHGIPRNGDYNSGDPRGVSTSQCTINARGVRSSTANSLLTAATLRSLPNLRVKTRAHTARVVVEDGRATGVEYYEHRHSHDDPADTARRAPLVAHASTEVILCGGAVNSPQLLMLSGIGPRAHLESVGVPCIADLPGVGENLQDHLFTPVTREVTKPGTNFDAHNINTVRHVARYMLRGQGPLRTNCVEAMAFTDSELAPDEKEAPAGAPDMQIHFFCRGGNGPPGAPRDEEVTSEKLFNLSDNPDQRPLEEACVVLPTLIHPKSRGTIKLRSSSPFEHPIIDPHYLEHPDDVKVMADGCRLATRILNEGDAADSPFYEFTRGGEFKTIRSGPNDAGVSRDDWGSDEFWREFVRQKVLNVYHYAGTCAMGRDDDKMAVLDSRLRVRGVRSLRVADCSSFPMIPGANTNAPAIMVGEKCAELIEEDCRSG